MWLEISSMTTNLLLELPGSEFVTCKDCPDFDLCLMCFRIGTHGHHPGHRFQPVGDESNLVSSEIRALCAPGRGVTHNAICDGCDKVGANSRHWLAYTDVLCAGRYRC